MCQNSYSRNEYKVFAPKNVYIHKKMPLYVRRLPGTPKRIVDHESLPMNTAIFNPSFADPYIYLRICQLSSTEDRNDVMLYNIEKKTTHNIPCPWELMAPTVNLFKGVEDFRICWHQGKLWFSGTTTHMTKEMNNELIMGYFDKEFKKIEVIQAVDIGSLPVKNVCPFVWKDQLLLLDILKKVVYLVTQEEDGTITASLWKHLREPKGISLDDLRGSTSPVHLHGNTWGCVIHDIIYNDNLKLVTRLSYLHHWMEFDIETGEVTFLSSPFWVAHWGIEYVSGIRYQRDTGEVTLFLGVNDRHPLSFDTSLDNLRIGK